MIVESVLDLFVSAIEIIFGWINLPQFPAELVASVEQLEDLMFSNLSMLSFFVRVSTVKLLVPLVIVIVNFDKVYRLTMFVIRKLPFSIE